MKRHPAKTSPRSCPNLSLQFLITSLLFVTILPQLPAQGFEFYSQPFPVPHDGAIHGAVPLGIARIQNQFIYHTANGSREWETRDMNGDGLPDLIVTSEVLQGDPTTFGGTTNPHWWVYLGTGTAFSPNPIAWSLPSGGFKDDGLSFGFHYLSTAYYVGGADIGCQVWTTRDMDADGLPDLVVMSQKTDNLPVTYVYRNGNQPYWKVYLNTGNGFSSSPIQWNVPEGGRFHGAIPLGFYIDQYASFSQQAPIEHQSWEMNDLDGDGKDDLVVMSMNGIGIGLPNQPQWWVYHNTGNGFDTAAFVWLLPDGGFHRPYYGNIGFVTMYGFFATQGWDGSNNWVVMDIDHDGLDDLVVTSEQDAPSGNYAPVFGLPNNPHWRVFHNNGTRFEANYTTWRVPQGGFLDSVAVTGFDFVYPLGGPYRGVGSEYWDVVDMDGDGLEDLVVTAEKQSDGWYAYQPDTDPHWRVFMNLGNGFDTIDYHWPIPYGGRRTNGILRGFVNTQDNAIYNDNIGSRNWALRDLNGDQRPDFILTGTKTRTDADGIVFGIDTNNTHWKIHWNTAAPVGEPESASTTEMSIYPNPATDVLHIDAGHSSGQLRICDIHGRMVHQAPISRNQLHTVDLRNWSSGLYFVEFIYPKGKEIKKIAVQ